MSPAPARQQGLSTLVMVMVLFFIMALVAAYANRNLIVEQRIAQTYRALSDAHEAHHQAVHRLISLLNSGRIDARCRPDPQGPSTLRQRLLVVDNEGHIGSPAAALNPAQPAQSPFTMLCDRRRPGPWECQCPPDLRPLPQADDGEARESTVMRIRPLGSAGGADSQGLGLVGLSVRACAAPSGACLASDPADAAVVERVQALMLVPALKMPPVSALVARGHVDLGDGMVVAHNEAGLGGLALHAGGQVLGQRAGVSGPAGAPAADAMLSQDARLAGLDEEAFFRRHFGLRPAEWLTQPATRRLDCAEGNDCSAALQSLLDSGIQLVRVDGDLRLASPVVLGSALQPVLLVVRGALTIRGPLRLHGVVAVRDHLSWQNASADASLVQGAVLVGGEVHGGAGAAVLFDGATVERLRLQAGSFLPLPGGSWSRSW